MTEADWLACDDPAEMLYWVRDFARERQLRLLAVAAIWPHVVSLGDQGTHDVICLAEDAADGMLTRGDLRDARDSIGDPSFPAVAGYTLPPEVITRLAGLCLVINPFDAALSMASFITHLEEQILHVSREPNSNYPIANEARSRCRDKIASHARDIFGNPFRSAGIERQWRTSTVVALAQQMYESRDFSAMPILADALQDAGCDSDDILTHCRGTGPHCRGCWVVDAVLGKV